MPACCFRFQGGCPPTGYFIFRRTAISSGHCYDCPSHHQDKVRLGIIAALDCLRILELPVQRCLQYAENPGPINALSQNPQYTCKQQSD
jgi:hypothetical protein